MFTASHGFYFQKGPHWKAGVGYRVPAAVGNNTFCRLQGGWEQRSSCWLVTNTRELNSPFVFRRPGRLWGRSQVVLSFCTLLFAVLSLKIFSVMESAGTLLWTFAAPTVQCIFLLMKAERVPLGEQTRLFCAGEYGDTLKARWKCWEAVRRRRAVEEHGRWEEGSTEGAFPGGCVAATCVHHLCSNDLYSHWVLPSFYLKTSLYRCCG